MNTRTGLVVTTLAVTIALLTFHPIAPLGATLWPQDAAKGAPPEWSLPLFLLLFVAEAAVSAFGVAYLLFGWRFTRRTMPERPRLAAAVHASLAFLLIQWWPHGNLHMSVPFSFGSILAIDYAFHVPIMVASLTLVAGVVHVARRSAARAAPSPRAHHTRSGETS